MKVKDEVAETPLEALASICTILALGMFVFGFIGTGGFGVGGAFRMDV